MQNPRPQTQTFSSFDAPKRILLGPGPSDVHQRVLHAASRATIGHLDPAFIRMMDELKALLRYSFLTDNEATLAISAPGSAGMEACFVNLVEAGDKVIVCKNGFFGGRMKANVDRCRGEAIMVEEEWGKPIDPQKVEDALKAHPDAKILAFVHAETSTGVGSDAQLLASLAKKYDCLSLVDAVTSFGGSELRVDEWGLDAVYSGSQKCFSSVPGISPITFSARAIERVNHRKQPVQSWFLDINLLMAYWTPTAKRAYHHTAPSNSLYALHEALLMGYEEGIENRWARHRENHLLLRTEVEALGMDFFVEEAYRLHQLNAVRIPKGVDEAKIRSELLNEYGIEIGAGLGPMAGKIWRIGLMGYSSRKENIDTLAQALRAVLS